MKWRVYLERYRMQKKKERVQDLIGIKELRSSGVLRKEREEEVVVFLLEAENLSVLSEAAIRQKVYGLMTILKGITELELCCVNSRENFTENKRYLKRRMEAEKNPAVRQLLQLDLEMLETMERQNSGAREFLLFVRLSRENTRDVGSLLTRVERAFREQAIRVKRAEKEDMKRILSVYFAQHVTPERLADYDGERWVYRYEETAE